MTLIKKAKCLICPKPALRSSLDYPFCSARCKTIDLGAWSAEEYVISRPLNESDEHFQPEGAERPSFDD